MSTLSASRSAIALIAGRYAVEIDGAIEHPTRVDLALEYVGQEFLDVGARRCDTAGQGDVSHELGSHPYKTRRTAVRRPG